MSDGLTVRPSELMPAAIAPEDTRTTAAPICVRSCSIPSHRDSSRVDSGSPVEPTRDAVSTFTTTRSPETISGLATVNTFLGLELEGGFADPHLVTQTRPGLLQHALDSHRDQLALQPADRLVVVEIGHRNRALGLGSTNAPRRVLARNLDRFRLGHVADVPRARWLLRARLRNSFGHPCDQQVDALAGHG